MPDSSTPDPTQGQPRPPSAARPRIVTESAPREWDGDDLSITGLGLTAADLTGVDASYAEISASRFTDVRLGGSRWRHSAVADSELIGCDLANTVFAESGWQRVAVRRSRLTGLQLAGCALRHVELSDCGANLVNLRSAELQRVAFAGCSLVGSDWGAARLTDVSFTDCDLTEAAFSNARMTRVHFVRCRLLRLSGVTGLAGSIVDRGDLLELAETLAATVGIRVADR
ncbi:hypothetical protein GCM10011575_28720 [Microlunatus endophyticus]|uniref:Pentapeptide repeat-containing protein n=1 Tax=Microlunatus endophyticus TaxID=1716077 RepID=A0A917W653_9ACTN|nr:pentapeptide repeat-containing protein [Microlunatus endophyticus]GGL68350.1 hypothetical protein GCM10011575_28720 [Microlunatus endophyticus]